MRAGLGKVRWKRALALSAGVGLVLAALLGYGWRFGFTALPIAPPGVEFRHVPARARGDLTPDNCWYWCVVLGRVLAADPASRPFLEDVYFPALENWARARSEPSTAQEELQRWFQEHPTLDACLAGFVDSPDSTPPTGFVTSDVRAFHVLAAAPRVRAALLESEGRAADAFRSLIQAWVIQARLNPATAYSEFFDERGREEVNALLARPWRRLALEGPPLPLSDGQEILARLAQATNALPTLETAFARLASRGASLARREWQPDWRQVRMAYSTAWIRMRQDAGRLVLILLDHLFGGGTSRGTRPRGIRHFGRPLAATWRAIECAAARPGDFASGQQGWLSQQLAEIRAGRVAAAQSDRVDQSRGWLAEVVDRPAVWRSIHSLPRPAGVAVGLADWLVALESCRLTLALRLYRDRHGRWPEALADLCPDILPAVPVDPFSGAPFRYERVGTGWRFWSVGLEGHGPDRLRPGFSGQREFTSHPGDGRP